jgi:hypothetical protein
MTARVMKASISAGNSSFAGDDRQKMPIFMG